MRLALTILLSLAVMTALCGCVAKSPTGKPFAYHYQMGVSYLEERNFTAALSDLTEAEKLDPNNAELQYNMGRTLVGKRRLDLAERKFLRAIVLKPNYSEARNDLGVLYLETGNWDNAIQQFRAVKDDLFYPNYEHAVINLGLAYLGKGDYAAAQEELSSARAANPRSPVIRASIGRILFAQGKTEQAILEYRKALEIAPDYASAHYHMGLALMKVSKLDAARNEFKEVLRIAPDSELGRLSASYVDLLR